MSAQATQPILTSRFWEQLAEAISTKVQDAVGPATSECPGNPGTVLQFGQGDSQLRLLIRGDVAGVYANLYQGNGQMGAGIGVLHTWSIFLRGLNDPCIAGSDMSDGGEMSELSLDGDMGGPLAVEDRNELPSLVDDMIAVIQGHLDRLAAA